MEYIIIFLFCISGAIAFLITKKIVSIRSALLLNLSLLFVNWGLLFLPRQNDFIVNCYVIFFVLTIFGIIMRFVAPIILNLINRFFSTIQHQKYVHQTYTELLNEGHRMFFCVLLFNTLRIFLQLLILMALFFDF